MKEICLFVKEERSWYVAHFLAFLILDVRRTVVSIPCGPSALAVKEAAWGLARYAAISQVSLQLLNSRNVVVYPL